MYNHLITCVHGTDKYETICESAQDSLELIIILIGSVQQDTIKL